jgi:hypothetical protein
VQLASPCDGEELVVNVHAVFFGLVAGVHVEASPEAMIPPAVFHVVAVLSGHGQSAGAASVCVWWQRRTEREGDTHPVVAIVTIGATIDSGKVSTRRMGGRRVRGGLESIRRRRPPWER